MISRGRKKELGNVVSTIPGTSKGEDSECHRLVWTRLERQVEAGPDITFHTVGVY